MVAFLKILNKLHALHLKQRLWLYAFAVSFVVVLLAGSTMMATSFIQSKSHLITRIEQQSNMLSELLGPALSYQKDEEVAQIIRAAGMSSGFASISLFDHQENLVAIHSNQLLTQLPQTFTTHADITVVKAITYDNKKMGTLVIGAELTSIYQMIAGQAVFIVFILVVAFLLAVVFGRRIVRSVKLPLDKFQKTLTELNRTKDYSLRAPQLQHHDLTDMMASFNQFVSQIEQETEALKASKQQLQLALRSSNEVLFDWDLESDTLYCEGNLQEIMGNGKFSVPDTLETYLLNIHEHCLAQFEQALSDHLKEIVPYFISEHRLRVDNDYRWVMMRGKVVKRSDSGRPIRLVGTLCDIHTRKLKENELKLFHDVFKSTTEAIVITDSNLRIIQCNPAFVAITGYPLEQISGNSIEMLYSDKHPPSFYNHIRYTIQNFKDWQGDMTQKRRSGELYPTHMSIKAMQNGFDAANYFVCVFSDLTTQRMKDDKLDYLTHFDPLTGLPNLDQFKKTLAKCIHLASEAKERFAVIMIGLDQFKRLNDTLGHTIGDSILKTVGNRLKPLADHNKHLARLGGDEFALIVSNVTDKDHLILTANKILALLSDTLHLDNHELNLGGCCGISVYPHDGQDVESLIANADTAMMHAKAEQRHSYQFFTQSMNEQVVERHKMESLIRKALENEEFVLFYQPKICVKTKRILGAEALIRWQSPQLGDVPPSKFIPVCEESGLILPLGSWALKQACIQGQAWASMGWDYLTLAVNVSALQFKQNDFIEFVTSTLEETGFNPHQLELEITEGAVIKDLEHCNLTLNQLSAAGIRMAIDDFGTGYSSLSYIKSLAVHTLKIDKSFVRKITTSNEDAHIVAAIISMAQGLNLKTVAEGVETAEQVDELEQLGCDFIQGFYFNKALPVQAFETYFISQDSKQTKDAS